MLNVVKKENISKNMIRITLQGNELNENFAWTPGCYVKLRVPIQNGQLKTRTYTLRNHNSVNQTIAIDFAIHEPAGYATNWAMNVKEGDKVDLKGPGQLKINPKVGDWYIFSADMAALPAAISVMETLNNDAKGYAFLEVTNEEDKQKLSIPEGIEVRWLIHPNPKNKSEQQLDAIKKVEKMEGQPNIFVAGELSTIREIKSYINESSQFNDALKYISSYWKIGLQEEEHKMAKRMS